MRERESNIGEKEREENGERNDGNIKTEGETTLTSTAVMSYVTSYCG